MIGVPTGILEGWAFGGMMSQIPMIWLSQVVYEMEMKWYHQRHAAWLKKTADAVDTSDKSGTESKGTLTEKPAHAGSFGNYLFWISFCVLGQPVSVLLYYRAWYMREHPELVALAVAG